MHATIPQEPRQLARDGDDDAINVMRYVLALWRRKVLVLAGAIGCAAVALAIGLATPATYEATVSLVVTPPRASGAGEPAPVVNIATIRALAENRSVASQVVSEFKLAEAPAKVTVQRFLEQCLSVESLRDTNMLLITVRLPDAQLAAKVANRYAELTERPADRLSQEEALRARDDVKTQMDQSYERFKAADTALQDFQKTAQIELLRTDVDYALGQRADLLKLLVEIPSEKARLTAAEQELASRTQTGTVKRTTDSGGTLTGAEPKNEYANPVDEDLDRMIATSRTRLAGLEKERHELVDVRKLNASQLAQLSLLYQREAELARLNTEYDLTRKIYVDTATRFEASRLQVGRGAQLHVADTAVVPDRPVGPKVKRNAAAALVAGLFLSALAVLFVEAMAAASSRADR